MQVREIRVKSMLTKSRIPTVPYAVNPYTGCGHGCRYCYATFMKRFTGHSEAWGDFVDVKINAAEVLDRQLKRAKKDTVFFFLGLRSLSAAGKEIQADPPLS